MNTNNSKTALIDLFYSYSCTQGLSQDLETGCLKLAIEKFLGIQIFEGYPNTLRFQP